MQVSAPPPSPPPPPVVVATPLPEPAMTTDDAPLEATVAAEETLAPAAAATEISLQQMNWTEVEALIQKHVGKIVVVDVWSTSCEPCLREFPRLIALQRRYPQDVVCIGLNCDYVGIKKKPPEFYHEKVLKALTDRDAKIVNVLCTMPSDDLFASLKIDSIPAVFVYDREGKRAHTFDNRNPSGAGEGVSYETQVDPAVATLVGK
jgi:thiol-disulfide isomerase/thioredoxin